MKRGKMHDRCVAVSGGTATSLRNEISPFASMPLDAQDGILSYLCPKQIVTVISRVSKSFNRMAVSKNLWIVLRERHGWKCALNVNPTALAQRRSKGSVHKATVRGMDIEVIVRTVSLETTNAGIDDGVPTSCMRDIALLSELDSPHLTKLLGAEVDGNKIRTVTENMPCSLMQFMADGGFKENREFRVKSIIRQVCAGLCCLHHRGIVHRNLKAENVFIRQKGEQFEVKIGDLAMARLIDIPLGHYTPEDPKERDRSLREQRRLYYKAPELLLRTALYGVEVDMWSLGCLFVEIANDVHPFRIDAEIGLLFSALQITGTPDLVDWMSLSPRPNVFLNLPKWRPMDFKRIARFVDDERAQQKLSENDGFSTPQADTLPQCLQEEYGAKQAEAAQFLYKFGKVMGAEGLHLLEGLLCLPGDKRVSSCNALSYPILLPAAFRGCPETLTHPDTLKWMNNDSFISKEGISSALVENLTQSSTEGKGQPNITDNNSLAHKRLHHCNMNSPHVVCTTPSRSLCESFAKDDECNNTTTNELRPHINYQQRNPDHASLTSSLNTSTDSFPVPSAKRVRCNCEFNHFPNMRIQEHDDIQKSKDEFLAGCSLPFESRFWCHLTSCQFWKLVDSMLDKESSIHNDSEDNGSAEVHGQKFLSLHPPPIGLSSSLRALVVCEMWYVQSEFELTREAIYLGVSYFDRYMSLIDSSEINSEDIRIIGITSLKIADVYREISKEYYKQDNTSEYAEIYCDYRKDSTISKAATADRILAYEKKILSALNFVLAVPTTIWFLHAYCLIANVDEIDCRIRIFANHFADVSLIDSRLLRFRPSLKAQVLLLIGFCTYVSPTIEVEIEAKGLQHDCNGLDTGDNSLANISDNDTKSCRISPAPNNADPIDSTNSYATPQSSQGDISSDDELKTAETRVDNTSSKDGLACGNGEGVELECQQQKLRIARRCELHEAGYLPNLEASLGAFATYRDLICRKNTLWECLDCVEILRDLFCKHMQQILEERRDIFVGCRSFFGVHGESYPSIHPKLLSVILPSSQRTLLE